MADNDTETSGCLVEYEVERRNHYQNFIYNRRISEDGSYVDQWGVDRRTVSEVTILLRGDKDSVADRADELVATSRNKSYVMTRVDSIWWEARVTTVVYGDWETEVSPVEDD